MIYVTCGCGRRLKVADEHAGKAVTCPACKEPVSLLPPPSPFAIDTGPRPDDDPPPEPPPLSGRVAAGFGRVIDSLRSTADTRPTDQRRHDEVVQELRSIRFRLGWIVLFTLAGAVGSCATSTTLHELLSAIRK